VRTVLIVGTMDTKAAQILFVKEWIEKLGHRVVIIDTGTRGASPPEADITCDEVARAAGTSIEEVRRMKELSTIVSLMIDGAIKKAKELLDAGRLDGVMSLGGAGAATIGTAVMKALPFGIPKLMVSSAAGIQAYGSRWFGTGDIMMMNTVVDIAGMNEMVKNILARAAGAIAGQVEVVQPESVATLLAGKGEGLVAMTEDGSCERCGAYVRNALQEKGYEVIIFHAQGLGDRAMEELIDKGYFDGVVDLATIGVSDEIWEGNRAGGPDRLEAAGRRGIPLVLTPCGLNVTGCGPTRKNVERYTSRSRIHRMDDLRMGTRYNEEELLINARTIALKLNKAKGPVRIFVPLRGFSSWDVPGSVIHAPEEDMILINELRRCLKPEIKIVEVDANLEDEVFAQALVDGFVDAMRGQGRT
jgi:uncharacterized protein (UPF0261 family)